MKSKITFILILFLLAQIKSFAQFESSDMFRLMLEQQRLQQMQQAYQQIQFNYRYYCIDGESISCDITMARMNGFSNATAVIQNRDRTIQKELKIKRDMPFTIDITVRKPDWALSYGDRIIITYDGSSTRTLNVGTGENMSEVDWQRYKESLIFETQNTGNYNAFINVPDVNGDDGLNEYSSSDETCLTKIVCSLCSGTGHVDGFITAYGLDEKWCEGCQKMVPESHCHQCDICPACNGRGYSVTVK